MRTYIDLLNEAKKSPRVLKAPETGAVTGKSVFLAGSIDQGAAVDWQTEVTDALADLDVTIFNPRRDDWDDTWVQDISNDQFRGQVEWELSHMERCDVMCVYFDPKGQAPITLMELGLHARSGKVVVCCPEGYWRRGNVQVVCARYGIPMVNDLDALISAVKERLT